MPGSAVRPPIGSCRAARKPCPRHAIWRFRTIRGPEAILSGSATSVRAWRLATPASQDGGAKDAASSYGRREGNFASPLSLAEPRAVAACVDARKQSWKTEPAGRDGARRCMSTKVDIAERNRHFGWDRLRCGRVAERKNAVNRSGLDERCPQHLRCCAPLLRERRTLPTG